MSLQHQYIICIATLACVECVMCCVYCIIQFYILFVYVVIVIVLWFELSLFFQGFVCNLCIHLCHNSNLIRSNMIIYLWKIGGIGWWIFGLFCVCFVETGLWLYSKKLYSKFGVSHWLPSKFACQQFDSSPTIDKYSTY